MCENSEFFQTLQEKTNKDLNGYHNYNTSIKYILFFKKIVTISYLYIGQVQ